MTTMVLERKVLGGGWQWRGSLVHGGVLVALLAGGLALWSAVAVLVAVVAQPAPTLATLERQGVRGVPTVVVDGTTTLLTMVRHRMPGGGR